MTALPPGLIIGYGNTLRGHDGIGYAVAEALARRVDFARLLCRPQLTIELADDIAHAPWVIFVDADTKTAPGRIRVERLDSDPSLPAFFSHHLPAPVLLACARQWFGTSPSAWLVAIGAEHTAVDVNPAIHPDAVHNIACVVAHFARLLNGASFSPAAAGQ